MHPRVKHFHDLIMAVVNTVEAEGRDFTSQEKAKVDDLLKKGKAVVAELEGDRDLRKQLMEFGVEVTERGSGLPVRGKASAWGDAVLTAAGGAYGYKALVTGSVAVPSLSGTLISQPDRPSSLLELVPTVPLSGTDQFSFLQETVRTNNAAAVAAGATKPTSILTTERVDDRVRVIATLSEPVPRQYLDDVQLLRAYVEGTLRQLVLEELEDQVLNGNGVGENFTGLASASGTQDQAWDTDLMETTRNAITLLEVLNLGNDAFYVFDPVDWARIELATTNENVYLMGQDRLPVDRAARRLWGLPVAVTPAATAGTGWLIDRGSIALYEREQVVLSWSENTYDSVAGASDFQRNLVRFRAESRHGLALLRPAGAVEVDLTP